MTKPRILITAAAGKTGFATAMQLLEKDYPVRALVRRQSPRAEQLKKAGAELFLGNMHDIRDLRQAMDGVQRAYYCPPFGPNLLHASMMFAVAAEEAKLEVVTKMTQWFSAPLHESHVTREHWLTDQTMPWMPNVDVITINPALFAEFYLLVVAPVAQLGLLPMPLGDGDAGKNAPPSNEDIASVAVGTLMDPAPHIGKSYRPTGPELLSPNDIAGILGNVVGRNVKYMDVPPIMFVKAALLQGFPMPEIFHARLYGGDQALGTTAVNGPTEIVREIGGREPESFESIARRYYANHPDAVRSIGNKLRAMAFFARLMLKRAPNMDRYARDQHFPLIKNPVPPIETGEWLATHSNGAL
ncbi:MAG: NmrA family NAD(P)-binding protein [Pseudomonadota bacterium]